MSCSTYFNIYDLESSSLETEIGWTTQCVPNKVKLALFILLLLFFLGEVIAAVVLFIKDYQENREWNIRKRVYLFSFGGTLGVSLLLILFLSGVESRARYILFPFAHTFVAFSVESYVQVYINVSSSGILKSYLDPKILLIQKWNFAFVIFVNILRIIFFAVLPMIFYENPLVLNVVLSVMISVSYMGTMAEAVVMRLVSIRLEELMQPSPDIPTGADMDAIRAKVQHNKKLSVYTCGIAFIQTFFPIWVGVTARNGDPGMQGFFYYVFCYYLPYQIMANGAMMVMVRKAKGKGGSSNNPSDRVSASKETALQSQPAHQFESYSYSISELNGKENA